MIVRKITYGFVIQKFDTNAHRFVSQEFTAGDQCEYEDEYIEKVESKLLEVEGQEVYLPFDMVQPEV
jgi:hypothetical protein